VCSVHLAALPDNLEVLRAEENLCDIDAMGAAKDRAAGLPPQPTYLSKTALLSILYELAEPNHLLRTNGP
jgi:hypothetical protein